jgi:hypothetical protein
VLLRNLFRQHLRLTPPRRDGSSRELAALLAGSWREPRVPFDGAAEQVAALAPLLLGSGAAGLAWRRIEDTPAASCAEAAGLRDAQRTYTLHHWVHQREIKTVLGLLHEAGLDPVLIKGWAAARLYPDPGLRPYGDIDLCVPTGDLAAARRVLEGEAGRRYWVDLHAGFADIASPGADPILARTQRVDLDGDGIRVLAPEDHLHLLAVHFLRHGGWRPLWLCDLAAAVEGRPPGFDWGRCLGPAPRRAEWVACAIRLAHELLGARIDDTPLASRPRTLPGWLVQTVLRQWQTPFATAQAPQRHPLPMAEQLRQPAGLWRGLRQRWPDAISATVSVEGAFDDRPRLPYQLRDCARRAGRLLLRRPRGLP